MTPTPPSGPQTHFVEITKEPENLHFSFGYIRECVNLQLLWKPVTKETPMGGPKDIKYHTTIPNVTFDISGKGTNWREGSACLSDTGGNAFRNYIMHLIDAKKIKKGGKEFIWDKAKLMFVEVKE